MEKTIKLHDLNFKIMIDETEIDKAVTAVAEKINADYADAAQPPLVVGILNGAFMFLSDLLKKLNFNCELTFVKLASYEGTSSVGVVKDIIGLNRDIEGRDIIVVEDIVDTGNSIEHILNSLSGKNAASVKICTLFFKPNAYQKPHIPIDYPAMEIGNEFIVGYGLDYDQLGRNLKDIYVVCNE